MPSATLSDVSVVSPGRLLAEAVRDLLDDVPADAIPWRPVGRLTVERAYLPRMNLEDVGTTVVTVIPSDESGERAQRSASYRTSIDIEVSVLRKLDNPADTSAGKAEVDAMEDYSQRVLQSIWGNVVDSTGSQYGAVEFQRTRSPEELGQMQLFVATFVVSYRYVM